MPFDSSNSRAIVPRMLLGALLDTGADVVAVGEIISRLDVPGWSLDAEHVMRQGLRATHAVVRVEGGREHLHDAHSHDHGHDHGHEHQHALGLDRDEPVRRPDRPPGDAPLLVAHASQMQDCRPRD